MTVKRKNSYYAYILLSSGAKAVVGSWKECEAAVKGKMARFKGFQTEHEAKEWLVAGARYEEKIKPTLEEAIYFDAGTGRGHGTEVSVTDVRGRDLLPKILPSSAINEHGKHNVKGTNNYGELLGLKFALQIALADGVDKIFGDSKLVIDYWSKGYIKKEIPEETRDLAKDVAKLRRQFEKSGGTIGRVSGDHNPADLGFH